MLEYSVRTFQCKLLFLVSETVTLSVRVLQEFPRASQIPHHPVLHMFVHRRLQYIQNTTEARCMFVQAFARHLKSSSLII